MKDEVNDQDQTSIQPKKEDTSTNQEVDPTKAEINQLLEVENEELN